jgi:hypothetical protein
MKLKGNHQTSFTSVHIFKDKYEKFKHLSVGNGMSLQKLINRCVHRYVTDEAFRDVVDKTTDLQSSGSSF